MLKIVTVVGARPQFVKAAVLSRLFRDHYSNEIQEYLVHTGQHYDVNMSDVFFEEMDIPKPNVNLEIGSGTHGKMTGRMLESIEKVILDQKPDMLLVYGDTNSTLAGALAASKLHVPISHVEAGLRSFNMRMPEEQNRVLTDHISSHLFCPTKTAINNLKNEGILQGVFHTGDVMLDASLFYRDYLELSDDVVPDSPFALMTLHRAENTDDPERLKSIVEAVNEIGLKFVLPLHPRTKKMVGTAGLEFSDNIKVIDPVGYGEMLALENHCDMILTDSGGVQKEAYFFRKPCITMRDQTEWVETVDNGANILVGASKKAIVKAMDSTEWPSEWPELYGSGSAGKSIVDQIIKSK